MHDPLAPPPYAATQPTQVLRAPSRPGTPLEPLKGRRRPDRRSWLLAGLLGITGGAIVLSIVPGPLMVLLRDPALYAMDLLGQLALLAFAIVMIVLAYALAPGGVARSIVGILVLVAAIGGAIAFQHAIFYGSGVPGGRELRAVVSGSSILVLGGVLGWLLASGARWWGFLAVLLTPLVAVSQWILVLQGVPSGVSNLVTQGVALLVALVALLLSIPRRRA